MEGEARKSMDPGSRVVTNRTVERSFLNPAGRFSGSFSPSVPHARGAYLIWEDWMGYAGALQGQLRSLLLAFLSASHD